MASTQEMLKQVAPKLIPFAKTTVIYFVFLQWNTEPSLYTAVIKCLPIFSLIIFVWLNGLKNDYSKKVLAGLVFSSIGDACLCWPDKFLHGMLFFAVAHVFYISAFGVKPRKLPIGIITTIMVIGALWHIWPGLRGVMAIGGPFYGLILSLTVWRALARAFEDETLAWNKASAAIGITIFAVSDFIIASNMLSRPINNAQIKIMASYYFAQLLITLSVVGVKNDKTA